MHSKIRRRLGVAVVVITALASVASASPALAETAAETGTISGHYVRADGTPVTQGYVYALGDATSASGNFGSSGEYSISDLPPGRYRVRFHDSATGLEQYAYGARTSSQAAVIDVAAGQTATVDDRALPTGTLSGTVKSADGQPGSIDVYVFRPGDRFTQVTSVSVWVGQGGSADWQVAVPAGDYVVGFDQWTGTGWLRQYAPQSATIEGARTVTVSVGATTTVDETLLGIGSLSGHFSNADGTPAADWTAYLYDVGDHFVATTAMDSSGAFTFAQVLATSYKVKFMRWSEYREQWAYGRLTADTADPITVAAGAETVVDDRVLAGGTIVVRPTSAQNHKPVTGFCAHAGSVTACDNGTGVAQVTGVVPGQQYVWVTAADGRYFDEGTSLAIDAGGATSFNPILRPAASIVTTIRDRVTGAPVANACAEAVPAADARIPQGLGACSDDAGRIVLGPFDANSYNIFVSPHDSRYGVQWVGPNGGVGRAASALAVKAKIGSVVTIPPILLDEAGSISGRVTGGDGTPLLWADIDLESVDPGLGGVFGAYTDEDGRYTFTGLGPYDWPLYIDAYGWAPEWSGGAVSREESTPVRVRSGQTTSFDVVLTKGVTISGPCMTPPARLRASSSSRSTWTPGTSSHPRGPLRTVATRCRSVDRRR